MRVSQIVVNAILVVKAALIKRQIALVVKV